MNSETGKLFYREFLTGKYHDHEGNNLRSKYDGNLRSSDVGNKIEKSEVSHLAAENAELKERLSKIEKMLESTQPKTTEE